MNTRNKFGLILCLAIVAIPVVEWLGIFNMHYMRTQSFTTTYTRPVVQADAARLAGMSPGRTEKTEYDYPISRWLPLFKFGTVKADYVVEELKVDRSLRTFSAHHEFKFWSIGILSQSKFESLATKDLEQWKKKNPVSF